MSNENSDSDFEQFKTSLGLYVEDPWERVKFIFMKNPYGEYHPDLTQALQTGYVGFMVGTVVGGGIYQRKYLLDIKERSDANIYQSKKDAYRQWSSQSLTGFLKGAFKWGPRMAIFTGGFTLFASCAEAYRNKPGIIEHSIGGTAIGCFLKWNFGIRGMLVGGLVGMVLGTIYGITHFGLCKLTNKDAIQIKYGQYAFKKYMNEREAKKIMEIESSELGKPQSNSDYLNPLDTWEDDKQSANNKAEEQVINLNK